MPTKQYNPEQTKQIEEYLNGTRLRIRPVGNQKESDSVKVFEITFYDLIFIKDYKRDKDNEIKESHLIGESEDISNLEVMAGFPWKYRKAS